MILMKHKLGILLWKHMKERWRRLGHTAVEIGSGIMVFIILLLVKQILVQDRENMSRFSEDINLVDLAITPQNNLSESLMTYICSNNLNAHSRLQDTKIQCYMYKDKNGIETFLKNSPKFTKSDAVVAVQFKNLDSKNLPTNLDYSIQFGGFHNHNVTKLGDLYYIYHDPMIVAKNATFFANLQWEINKSFMKMLSGSEVDHVISFNGVVEHISVEMRVVHSFLVLCTVLAPMPFYMTTHAALVDEKRLGIMAMLKLSGVRQAIVRLAHLCDTIIFATIYSIIIVTLLYITSTPILKYSNPFIIFITFILHFLTITSLTFITSALSQNYQHSDSVAVLIYLMMFLINMLWGGRKFGEWAGVTMVYIVLPHSPMFMFWNDVIAFEAKGVGAQLRNLLKGNDPTDSACVVAVWGLFVFQLVLILTCAWYLDIVRPGSYGIALPWNFIFRKRYWVHTCSKSSKRKEVNFHVTAEFRRRKKILRDKRYFEPAHKGEKTIIKLAQVTKSFTVFGLGSSKTTTAIDQVDMDVYKNKITVILGTNGSGKTNLMSIITGMTRVTSGHVYIKGLDLETRLQDLRSDMTYCPQRDLTFDYLTVRENLMFFQNVRGSLRDMSIGIGADHMMELFKLREKSENYSVELSAGHRRCLQIACALIGTADVLVFDEPSLGMDAEMKHRLWDMLLTLRKDKTIVMSTSCMEEADALGDRIALLHHGKIKCYASPTFLKNAIGAEFKLSIRFAEKVDVKHVEDVIHDQIKEAEVPDTDNLNVLRNERSRMIVNLPSQHRDHFPKVFDMLEKNRREFGIMSMDVGISMEQVFLKFVEDDDIDFSLQLQEYSSEKPIEGWKLRRQQLFWLTKRVWMYVFCHMYQFIIVQILVPLLALIVITIASNSTSVYGKAYENLFTHKTTNTMILMEPGVGYRRMFDVSPMYSRYPTVQFVTSENVSGDLEYLSRKSAKNEENFVGIKNLGKRTEISYPITSASALSTAVNVASNMFMATHMPRGGSVNVNFEPFTADRTIIQPKNLFLCYCWSMWVTFLVIIPLGPLVRLCIEEYYHGVRFNHLLMGCPPYIIWLSKLLAHLAIYLAIVPCSVILVAKVLDHDHTIDRLNFLGALFCLLVMFAPAFLLHWYVLSFMLGETRPVAKMYVVSMCLGLITPIVVFFLSEASPGSSSLRSVLYIFYSLANLIPAFTFSVGMGKISKVARNNAFCKLNFHLCPNNMADDMWVPREVCCKSNGEPFAYFTNFNTGLFELSFLILQSIIYWIVLLLLQNRILQPIFNNILNSPFAFLKPLQNPHKSKRVKAETLYVQEKIKQFELSTLQERQDDPSNDMLLVSNILKTYHECCRPYVHAVKGISFAVKRGESIALLGKNGAGKTTTLSMIAGYTVMTSGVICLNGHLWKKERRAYLREVAWCRDGGFDVFFTGIQNLQYLAALYGYPARDTYNIANRFLQYMGLARYIDTPYSSYSPGCSHRLALCTAFINASSVVLLDELCTHMDPYTLPLVTRAVQLLKSQNIACVLAEESMEWKQIDEICNRLAIIDQGEIVTIGTVSEIRRALAAGYTAIIKLNVDKCYTISEDNTSLISVMSGKRMVANDEIEDLKLEFLRLFKTSLLVDEHMSMLYFHIKDPGKELTYSMMFNNLEQLTRTYDIVEDYLLRENSISEVLCRISERIHGDARQRRESFKYMDFT